MPSTRTRATRALFAGAAAVAALVILNGAMAGRAKADDISLDDWELTYANEFEQESDLDDFDTRYIWSRETIINRELQFYVDPDVHGINPFVIRDGVLSIVAQSVPEEKRAELAGQGYSSGVLTTRSRGHSQHQGYWEFRARVSKAGGAWSALWLLPTFEQWPKGVDVLSEIDIIESIGDTYLGNYYASYHTRQNGKLESSTTVIKTGEDIADEFQVYGFSWDDTDMIWYFNGQEVRRAPTPRDYTEPRHILMNLAIAPKGTWGGGNGPSPGDYQTTFDIDYVRVYRAIEGPSAPEVPEDDDRAAAPLVRDDAVTLDPRVRTVPGKPVLVRTECYC